MALEYLTWWLSPGVACFFLLNVLVAAIAVTSQSRDQPCGVDTQASLPQRVVPWSSIASGRSPNTPPYVHFSISPEAEERQVSRVAPDHQLAVPEPATMAAISMMSGNAEDETAAGVVKSKVSSDGNVTCALGHEGRHAQESMPSQPPPAAAHPAVAVVTAETARLAALVRGGPPKEEPATTVAEFVKWKHRCA